MVYYPEMSKSELLSVKLDLENQYINFKEKNLNLNIARGKPSIEQVNLSRGMLDIIDSESSCISENGLDCLNYGGIDGILEMKKIFSEILGIKQENIIVGGNSSLNMMFDTISCFMTSSNSNEKPWIEQKNIKFLCPCPGYDRHFSILEYFNIEPIIINMNEDGPDMDSVERLVHEDESIKGIWCVPKYSNPQGYTYSDEVVRRFAKLDPKASDFRIFWDNAYAVHDLSETPTNLLNIMNECIKQGNEDLPIVFCSTSKITFPGAGVAALGASNNNINLLKKRYAVQTIGYDKVNQLRHAYFLKDYKNILKHMKKHREILKPKFDIVLKYLKENFDENKIASFTEPKGGYFVSVNVMNGCASRVVELCKNAGLILTDAGATFPRGKDKYDSNIRIAPSYPEKDELSLAMQLFCICVKLATIEKLLIS